MSLKAVITVLAAVAGLGAPALAQDRAEREFQSLWFIQPSDQPLGPRSVNEDEFVFRNRLLPPALVRLSADAVDSESGEVIVPAGAQLFGLIVKSAPIYCVVGRRDPSTAARILLGPNAANRQVCLIDLDGNRVFDAHFRVPNQVRGVPNFSGRRPRSPDALTGAAFETLSPDQIEVEYFVGVKYQGMIGLTRRRPAFSIVFGTDRSTDRLTELVQPVRGSDPPLATPLRAEFVVSEVRGDTIDIDVRRNVPAQPFSVVRTVTYSYY